MPTQLVSYQEPRPTHGLRERKKARTRSVIEDAALTLFEDQGYEATTVEQIAARAEVSTTTFFRYFPSKAEVLLSDHGQPLPALHRAIVERPPYETDLVAIRHAVAQEWVAAVDPERTARKAQVVAGSDLLTGMSYHRGQRWLTVIVDALAQRRGLDPHDERCSLVARVGLDALASAVERWIGRGCVGDLAQAVDASFGLMAEMCGELSGREPLDTRSQP